MGGGFMGTGFQFCKMKHVLAMHGGDGLHNNTNIFNAAFAYFKKVVKMADFVLCAFYHNKIMRG